MGRRHGILFGYRIYRKKFLGTVVVMLLMTVVVFLGMLFFCVNSWMSELGSQVQNSFLEWERQLADMQEQAEDYANSLYGNDTLMEDLAALFSAENMTEYIALRRCNSLRRADPIGYLPADIKKVLGDSRNKISSVTLCSESGRKTIWLQGMDVSLSFDGEVQEGSFWGDILVASCSVGDPVHMSRTMGTMRFWASSRDIYEEDWEAAVSGEVVGTDGRILWDSGLEERQRIWLRQASRETERSGWIRDGNGLVVFYVQMESSQSGRRLIAVMDIASTMWDNFYMLAVLFAALMLINGGILLSSYAGIRSDANFLSLILAMLSDLEGGYFEEMQKRALPAGHRENEYGMIAAALQDVGRKLEEQETRMRALQHQINPHFLYNTLEMLRSKALVQGDRDMADAIAMLGTLYRARMHKKDSVLLKEEFELLEMYLRIMSMRYGDKFVYQTELEPAVEEMDTIVFWLQPLAENFFEIGRAHV